jgi:hypothetical protein
VKEKEELKEKEEVEELKEKEEVEEVKEVEEVEEKEEEVQEVQEVHEVQETEEVEDVDSWRKRWRRRKNGRSGGGEKKKLVGENGRGGGMTCDRTPWPQSSLSQFLTINWNSCSLPPSTHAEYLYITNYFKLFYHQKMLRLEKFM